MVRRALDVEAGASFGARGGGGLSRRARGGALRLFLLRAQGGHGPGYQRVAARRAAARARGHTPRHGASRRSGHDGGGGGRARRLRLSRFQVPHQRAALLSRRSPGAPPLRAPPHPRSFPPHSRGLRALAQRVRRLSPLRACDGHVPDAQGGGGPHGLLRDATVHASHGALPQSLPRHDHGLRSDPPRVPQDRNPAQPHLGHQRRARALAGPYRLRQRFPHPALSTRREALWPATCAIRRQDLHDKGLS